MTIDAPSGAGACFLSCPTTALERCGRSWPMDELMAEVEKERMVMEQSGGGVTLCGGEPLMHPDYTLELLRELGRRGFHRCVDTTLYAPRQVVADVAANCELFLADLKLMDDGLHRRYTGVGNELILRNFRFLAQHGMPFLVRIPLIEGINADEQNIEATACFLASLPKNHRQLTVHLLPYHDVGKDKHRRMLSFLQPSPFTPSPPSGEPEGVHPSPSSSRYNPDGIPMATPSDDTLQRCSRQLEAHGLRVVIGG